MRFIYFAFVIFFLVDICHGEVLANLFKPCKLSAPDARTCLAAAGQEVLRRLVDPGGIPQYNIKTFAPLSLGNMTENINGLVFSLADSKIFGFNNAKIEDISINTKEKLIVLKTLNNDLFEADYSARGFLIIPITGDGKATVRFFNVAFTYKLQYDVVKGKDGKDHWKIMKHIANWEPEKVEFKFTNLFNGNEVLGESVNRFTNENWMFISGELATPVLIKMTNAIVKNINKILSRVAIEDMIIP